METPRLNVVTGALGYTGRYITRLLLSRGEAVRTLTGHPQRPNPFGDRISVAPLNFEDPDRLVEDLGGVEVLYNTYWVRFPHGGVSFDRAVEHSETLIKAAEEAGVRRIVYVSITGASTDSRLPYFRGKGLVEGAIMSSRLSYAIVRPTVIFGKEDVLINNIAWFLRRMPVFSLFGDGNYPIQPVFVEDVAEIAVGAAGQGESATIEAAGPDAFTFEEMVRSIARAVGSKSRLVHVRPSLALWLSRLVGPLVRDVVITRDEIDGLMAGLLVPAGPPAGHTPLADWLRENSSSLGRRYASELERHYR